MPSYVSHTIMAKDVYKKINDKKVDYNYMVTFSLGGDLCKYSKCRYESHNIKQEDFLYSLCDYMKNNNLINDGECLGVLYGHICHLVMDEEMHPLIRKISRSCIKKKNNHAMIELYYDNYLTKLKYKVKLNKYNNKDLFKGKINKKISSMINYAYDNTYDVNNVSKYYKFNIWLYKKIRYLYSITSFNFLKRISGMNKFLLNNKDIDLINCDNKICYKDIRNKDCNDNIMESYNKSIERAIKLIDKYNKYLKK